MFSLSRIKVPAKFCKLTAKKFTHNDELVSIKLVI